MELRMFFNEKGLSLEEIIEEYLLELITLDALSTLENS